MATPNRGTLLLAASIATLPAQAKQRQVSFKGRHVFEALADPERSAAWHEFPHGHEVSLEEIEVSETGSPYAASPAPTSLLSAGTGSAGARGE